MKISRNAVAWMLLAVAIVGVASIGVLYARANAKTGTEYFEELALLRRIGQLDAQWEADVLKARSGMTLHFDPLRESSDELEVLVKALQASDEGADHDTGLADAQRALAEAVREKAARVEEFKSSLAILRNSLHYLPLAAEEVHKTLGYGLPATDAAHRVEEQLSSVLVASLLNAQGRRDGEAETIESIEALRHDAALLSAPQKAQVDLFTIHAETVLREQRTVNAVLDEIAAVPTARRAEDINALLNRQQQQRVQQTRHMRAYLLVTSVVLAMLLLSAAWQLRRNHRVLAQLNSQLHEANELLEQRVRERTQELRDAQNELVSTARRAGMAEIASNVLHNVGNILNSVNVSADLVASRLRNSCTRGLARAADLLRANEEELPQFFAASAKGPKLARYVIELSATAQHEQAEMVAELDALRRSIDHIKTVVATQQSYATHSSSPVIRIHPHELVEDALRISGHAVTSEWLEVVRDYGELPQVLVDRDRVLQILVNLLSNARQSMKAVPGCRHRLVVQAQADAGMLRVRVIDDGEGIPVENLTRIFTHGFTTRKEGHGFGLHSCALAAQQMGGTLEAHSDGPGAGATFTLHLPLGPAPVAEFHGDDHPAADVAAEPAVAAA